MKKNELREKRRRRKLLIAILMILFTGVLLSTSTYAWFTANKTVTVEKIDVNVAAENGLQLSVDGTNWKPVITNADIDAAINTYTKAVNQLPKVTNSIVPTSTIGEVDATTGFLKMFTGAVETSDDHYILTAERTTETNTSNSGSFIAFDLFFRTTTDTPIYLTDSSSVSNISGPNGLQNAARVAFLLSGNTTTGAALADIQGMKAADNTGLYIWEPNYDVHTAAAVKNATDNYQITTTESNGSLLSYVGVKAPIDADDDVRLNSKDSNFFASVVPKITSPAAGIASTAYAKAFDLKAGITKVRIYMWIEGQDVDCENDASGSSVSFNVQFSMNSKA